MRNDIPSRAEFDAQGCAHDILQVLNFHAACITAVQRIALSEALCAVVESLAGQPTQRVGSLVIEAPVAPIASSRRAYTQRDVQPSPIPVVQFPANTPKHITLIAE
jgi:hypothetical protein